MKVEQIYTGCLAQAAYYIESDGEAAVIDPLRDVSPYLAKSQEDGARIKWIFETHFHADFVSGHVDLAKQSGGTIVYGPNAKPGFEAHVARDGEEFAIGRAKVRLLHTPGHTMESSCYLLIDEEGKQTAIFTGDTLFIGDVGRPDLAVKSDLSKEDLAGHLYDSLHNKLLPLKDTLTLYPGHGAGSACGKHMSKETTDTLGHQKQVNYALQPMKKEAFVEVVLEGMPPPPQYFPKNAMLNRDGYESVDNVIERGTEALEPEQFEELANSLDALVLDTRSPQAFHSGFIPRSINIGLDGHFASWVGSLIPDLRQPILLLADSGREEEAVTRLARVGYDNTLGYLQGGIQAWQAAGKEVDCVESISPEEFARRHAENHSTQVLDVRTPKEYEVGHLNFAESFPLDFINDNMSRLVRGGKYYLHCGGGYRSMVAASILKARGLEGIVNIEGGYDAIKKTALASETTTGSHLESKEA